jgi:hypothetical protein
MQPKAEPPQPGVPVARQYGTSGRPVKVLANTFAIRSLPTQTIYHYDGELASFGLRKHSLPDEWCPPGLSWYVEF